MILKIFFYGMSLILTGGAGYLLGSMNGYQTGYVDGHLNKWGKA